MSKQLLMDWNQGGVWWISQAMEGYGSSLLEYMSLASYTLLTRLLLHCSASLKTVCSLLQPRIAQQLVSRLTGILDAAKNLEPTHILYRFPCRLLYIGPRYWAQSGKSFYVTEDRVVCQTPGAYPHCCFSRHKGATMISEPQLATWYKHWTSVVICDNL